MMAAVQNGARFRLLPSHRDNQSSVHINRVHGPCWSPVYPTRPVSTGVIFDASVYGPCPWTRESILTPVFTGSVHGSWTRVVCTEL